MENYKRILMKGSFKPYVGKYNNNKPIKVDIFYVMYLKMGWRKVQPNHDIPTPHAVFFFCYGVMCFCK